MRGNVVVVLLLSALPGYAQDQAYQNPIDDKAYTAQGGWETYLPEGGVQPSSEMAAIDSVRLLQNQEEMAARTAAAELSSFIKLAQSAVSQVFHHYDRPASLLVQFTCTPGEQVVEVAFAGEPPQDLLKAYYDKLTTLRPFRVSAEVKFQVMLKIQP
jgi:hypothetical protein